MNEILTLLQEIQDCAKKLKKAGNDEYNLHGKLNALRAKINVLASYKHIEALNSSNTANSDEWLQTK